MPKKKSLVKIVERREYWRFEPLAKKLRQQHGKDWINYLLDNVEREEGTEARKNLGEYLLRMHQIQILIWMETHRTEEDNPLPELATLNKPE